MLYTRRISIRCLIISLVFIFGIELSLGSLQGAFGISNPTQGEVSITSAVNELKKRNTPKEEGEYLKALNKGVIENIKKKASEGSPEAIWLFGKLHEFGIAGPVNLKATLEQYKKASQSAFPPAIFSLAEMYRVGLEVEQDRTMAILLYRLAAREGDAKAMNNLGFALAYGDGVTKDGQEAIRWLQKAAELGNGYSMGNLGFQYMKGVSVQRDDVMAFNWLKKGDEAGNKKWATNLLGMMYFLGRGTEKDLKLARRCFREAAEAGSYEAMWNLGVMERKGWGGPQDLESAEKHFKMAREGGMNRTNYDQIDISIIETKE